MEDSKQLTLQSPFMSLKSEPRSHTQHRAEKHRLVLVGPGMSLCLGTPKSFKAKGTFIY